MLVLCAHKVSRIPTISKSAAFQEHQPNEKTAVAGTQLVLLNEAFSDDKDVVANGARRGSLCEMRIWM